MHMPLKPRKKPEPRPLIRTVRDIAKAKVGWSRVLGAKGLYLVYDPPGKRHPDGLKRWMFRYKRPNGEWNEISLDHVIYGGGLDPLERVLNAWHYCQWRLSEGKDPQEFRSVDQKPPTTFAQCAKMFIEAHGPGKSESWFRNAKLMFFKHGARLAKEAVGTISSTMVEKAIAPLMASHPAQARLALAKWEELFDFARAKNFRTRDKDNPAEWKGQHEHIFSGQQRKKIKHHPALPYWEMPTFMPELRQHQAFGVGAVCLEMVILTVGRPNKEVRLMQWDEIDWDNKIWTCPAERMKMRATHLVPLVPRAMTLLDHRRNCGIQSPYVFTGRSPREPLAARAMINLLRNMGISNDKADVHGFRRTFRTWCRVSKKERDASEMCLGHAIAKPVEGAYLDTDLLDERREILNAWSAFIG